MKVKELVAILQDHDPDAEIVIYEDYYHSGLHSVHANAFECRGKLVKEVIFNKDKE